MKYYIPLSFKNVFRQRRRSFTLGVNFLFVAFVLTLLFSFSAGVQKNISENIVTSAAGHLSIAGDTVVNGKTYVGMSDYPVIVDTVQQTWPGSKVLVRYYVNSAVYHQGLSKRLSFTGIDTAVDTNYRDQIDIQEGDWNGFAAAENGILLPRDTAEFFGLKTGDEVLVANRSRFGAFNTATFQVKGIYESANYFVQGIVIAHFRFLQNLDLADPGAASNLFVYFPDAQGFDQKREDLMDLLSAKGFKVKYPEGGSGGLAVITAATPQFKAQAADVNQKNLTIATIDEVLGILSQILAAVNGVGLFVAAILLFIIAVSIFINMRISINDRMQEIGTLRAMGTERRDVVMLFVYENVFLSLLFTALGILFALAVVLVFGYGISLPPKGVMSLFLHDGHLVLAPSLGSITLVLAIVAGFTALFSYFPARKGGSVSPAVALAKTF